MLLVLAQGRVAAARPPTGQGIVGALDIYDATFLCHVIAAKVSAPCICAPYGNTRLISARHILQHGR